MIKVIYFLNSKTDLSVEGFQNYWRTTHAERIRQIPNLQRYAQCHTLLSGYGRPNPPVLDGVEEIVFDSKSMFISAMETSAGRAALKDFDAFVDRNRLKSIVTEEIEIKPGSVQEGMVKNIELVTRKQGMPIEEFHAYWRDHHGPLAAKIDMIQRYIQSHTLMEEYEKDMDPAYDGVAETWFKDTAAMRLSASTPEYAATRADEQKFLAEPLPFIITREIRII